MARFHINNSGDAGLCRAVAGNCPFGDDSEHYGSQEEAREAYEERMAKSSFTGPKAKAKRLHKDLYVSVLTSNNDVLTENFSPNLASDLEPGDYVAQYYDDKTKEDKYIKIKIDGLGSPEYEDLEKFESLSTPTSESTLKAFKEADLAYAELNVDPTHCEREGIERITLLESAKGFERILAKYELSRAEDAVRARLELEDLEWVLDHDLEIAERDGRESEVKALEVAKAPLTSLLDKIRR